MSIVNSIFERIHQLTREEGQCEFVSLLFKNIETVKNESGDSNHSYFDLQKNFLQKIFKEIDNLALEIKNDNTILISVRNQKLLRTCFQLVTTLGLSSCLLPGLGLNLYKRCSSAAILPPTTLTDEQKYVILIECTDFFTRTYEIPVYKNIILTFHLSDYLAALIQLSFAPFKKPGTYNNFVMTQEMFDILNKDRQKYLQVYEHLVADCFQPTLMKELLILQSVTEPSPPVFVKRIISKELSRRLLAPGGLLSLIRCLIESYEIDTGFEWKKIDMICKIVASRHGNESEENYLDNICTQLKQILTSNNMHHLAAAVSCVLCLNEKHSHSDHVKILVKEIFQLFDYDFMSSKSNLPGTVILSPQEIEHNINILHACVCTSKFDWPISLLSPKLYILFLLGIKCTKNEELKIKLKNIILKCLEQVDKTVISLLLKSLLFGRVNSELLNISIEELEVGLIIKCVTNPFEHPKNEATIYLLNLVKASTVCDFVENVLESALQILIDLHSKRQTKSKKEILLTEDDDAVILDVTDEQYAIILQLLSEISILPKVISALKRSPSVVVHFIEYFILKSQNNFDEECISISLVLLNTILSNSGNAKKLDKRLDNLIPVLEKMAKNDTSLINILCKEALYLISSDKIPHKLGESACEKALTDVFDNLLPVRAHGIIELNKLIDAKDPETMCKKHYIFCLFQEQLKDADSYIYLSAINGIASLGAYCTEDVLKVLCREYLEISTDNKTVDSKDMEIKIAEVRMKIGDVIVKVTKKLGEMAIVHKTLLLNTVLCVCRDEDPLIRASALSNLAEIALVINYKIGTVICEILTCISTIIETDKAIECRRAAVMVISNLLKGLGKETLVELKENLLPIYRTLKNIYMNSNEDSAVRLHAQLALEELNDTVNQFLFPELKMQRQIFVLDKPADVLK